MSAQAYDDIREMVLRDHRPRERWNFAGQLFRVDCEVCGYEWPCPSFDAARLAETPGGGVMADIEASAFDEEIARRDEWECKLAEREMRLAAKCDRYRKALEDAEESFARLDDAIRTIRADLADALAETREGE